MSKSMQLLLSVGLLVFTVSTQAGITVDVVVGVNSLGQDIATFTATSDGDPITSLGIHFSGDGNIAQVHPMGFETPLQDYNPFMAPPTSPDQDTQAMFATAADTLLVVSGASDTSSLMEVNFTGFNPFQTRAIAQLVVDGGECYCEFGIVAGGELYTIVPVVQGATTSGLCIPEPASLGLLAVGAIALIRRR